MVLGWLAVTLLAFVVPLKIAAMIQEKAVFKLHDAYKQAPRKVIAYKEARWEGETLFVPEDSFPCHDCKINKEAPWARTRVLVARFKPGAAVLTPSFAYEWDTPGPELRGTGIVHVEPQADAGYLEYYFVVHLTDTCAEWNRFAGLLLPDEQADRLEGLYEITDLEKLGGLFHMTIPENREAFVPRQQLQLPWPCSFPEPYNAQMPPHFEQQDKQLKHLLSAGAYDDALAMIEPVLERRPDSVQFACLQIEAFLRKGDEEKAHVIMDRLLETYPNDYALYARLDRCFERIGGWEVAYANWGRIAAQGNVCAEGYIVNKGERIALVHQSQKRYEEALHFYEAVLRTVPETRFSAEQYDRICETLGDKEQRQHFWDELHAAFPKAAIPALYLGKSLELYKQFDEAMNLYRQVEALYPDEAEALLRKGFILAITESYEKGSEMMQQALQNSPGIKGDFIHSLEERGGSYKDTGDLVLAEKVYRILMYHEPENIWHQMHCAESLLAQGNYEASRKVLKQTPDLAWAAYSLEECLRRLEDPDLWMSTWKSLYEVHPDTYIPAYYYGRSLESNTALDVALNYFHRMYEKYPDKPEIKLRQGAFVAITEGYENGRALMDQALALNPDMQREHKKLLERIADHYGKTAKEKAAEELYRGLIEAYPEDGWIRVRYAELLLTQGNVKAAKQVFIDILDVAPESPYSAQKLSELLRQDGDVEAELAVWQSLCDRHPDAYVPCVYYAEALETAGFYEKARQRYRRLHESHPDAHQVILHLGALIAQLEDYAAGCLLMDNAVRTDASLQPLYIALITRLAVHFREQDDLAKAETLYRQLTTYKPEDVSYQICLAEVLVAQKKYGKARDVYAEVLRRKPDNAQAKLRHGMLTALLGDYEQGRAAMDAALEASPELSGEMAAGLACIAVDASEAGNHTQSEALYREAIALAPEDFWHQVRLGEFLMKQNRLAEAEAFFIQVLMARPESPQTAALLDEIYAQVKDDEGRLKTWKKISEEHPAAEVPSHHLEMALVGLGQNK